MTARRRVLIYCIAPKRDRGGVQAAVLALADGLRARGHAVLIAWPDGEAGTGDVRLPLCVDVGLSPTVLAAATVRGARDLFRAARLVARFRPDVVNVHFPRSQALYFAALRPLFGYRLLLSFHGSDALLAEGASGRTLPFLIRQAAGVTAVSAAVGETLTEMAPTAEPRLAVIRNGIDTAFWRVPAQSVRDRHHLVATGRLVPVKGFDILLRAVALCRGAGVPVRLTLFGDGPEAGGLERLASDLGVADHVVFAGHADPHTLRSTYAEAGVFVLSSRSEGLPIALLEAMAAGLVPVCTDVGGVGEVMVSELGRTVPPEDAAALAEAIGSVIGRWDGTGERVASERASAFASDGQHERFSGFVEAL